MYLPYLPCCKEKAGCITRLLAQKGKSSTLMTLELRKMDTKFLELTDFG
jgi:hypothetical protein